MELSELTSIAEYGFATIDKVYSALEISKLLQQIELAIAKESSNIKCSLGETYAARNLGQENPALIDCWKKPELVRLLTLVLGDRVGLFRILYFDKHPNRTWSLPWHKDMTIAVKDCSLPSSNFSKPTRKSGVDHVEASSEILEQMLTLRIHLDDVTDDNGPLEVVVGSHKNGKEPAAGNERTKILVGAGDVLAMRPLLSHMSGSSTEGTTRHRRVLHLEFAGQQKLPDGFEWHMFERVA